MRYEILFNKKRVILNDNILNLNLFELKCSDKNIEAMENLNNILNNKESIREELLKDFNNLIEENKKLKSKIFELERK